MPDLKKQIYYLERNIVDKKRQLNTDYFQFIESMKKPATIAAALIGSFAVGMLLSRKQGKKALMQKALTIPYFVNKVYRNFQLFSRFIPL